MAPKIFGAADPISLATCQTTAHPAHCGSMSTIMDVMEAMWPLPEFLEFEEPEWIWDAEDEESATEAYWRDLAADQDLDGFDLDIAAILDNFQVGPPFP
eukprot:2148257-Rhodomonas_salina.3